MRILALDTATTATAAALVDLDTGLELEARDDPPAGARPSHARALLGLVEDVLRRSGAGWEAIDRIAVGVGPGTFTGLRIGVASAQALAQSQAKPLVGVSTLHSLALGASATAEPGHTVLAVIDARRNEAFAGAWTGRGEKAVQPQPAGSVAELALLQPTVLTPEALTAEAARLAATQANVLAAGDGAIKFRALLESAGAQVPEDGSPLHRVSAIWHCRLAATATPQPISAVQPDYLRVPDAELNRLR